MFDVIKRKLSLKVSLTLALITIPPMVVAAYLITASESAHQEEQTINSGKIAALTGAKMYGDILEAGIDAGLFSLKDVMEPVYEDIKGFDWFDNPRWHTKYDGYTDRTITGMQDRILNSSTDFIYALGNDTVSYLPTHNSVSMKPITNDKQKDLNGNRTKR
jgi:hypothetical protein